MNTGRGLIAALIRSGKIDPASVLAATMPTRALERLREAAILEASLENVYEIPCRAPSHATLAEHPAHWHARCPGGGVIPICQARRDALEAVGFVLCSLCSGDLHEATSITWTRI